MKNPSPAFLLLPLLLAAGACSEEDPVEPVILLEVEDVQAQIESLPLDPPIDLSQMTRMESGVFYQDLVEGDPEAGRVQILWNAVVRYNGWLSDGTQFASDSPLLFLASAGEVISGWDLGLIGTAVGGTRRLVIPPARAYGEFGSGTLIPPNTVIIFDVTIDDVFPPS